MRVIILAKAPVAGKVKTRLMPQYTAEQATSLQQQMTQTVLNKVCSVYTDVWLAVDDAKHPFFQALRNQGLSFELHDQGQGDLGQRLQRLSARSFANSPSPILLIGTDSPHIHVDRYKQAEISIQQHDAVIGPVEDGGYDLIALSADHSEVFTGIAWGSSTVFKETLININDLALSLKVLDLSFDLDRAEDVERAPPHVW